MEITRRNLLLTGSFALPLLSAAGQSIAQQEAAAIVMLVLDAPEGFNDLNTRVVREFLNRGLPIAVTFDPAQSNLAKFPDSLISFAGLIELAAPAPDVAHLSRYAQMRGAGKRRAELAALAPKGIPATCLIDRTSQGGLDISAFRAAGFRILMSTSGTPISEATLAGRGQLLLDGGLQCDMSSDAQSLVEQISLLVAPDKSIVVVIPLADITGPRGPLIQSAIEELVDWLSDAAMAGQIVAMRPMDYFLQLVKYPQQHVALIVEAETDATAANDLLEQLSEAAIPATLAASPETLIELRRPSDCRNAPLDIPTIPFIKTGPDQKANSYCILLNERQAITDGDPADVMLHSVDDNAAWTGIRDDARLHAVTQPWRGEGSQSNPVVDAVIVLKSKDYATPELRSALVETLISQSASDEFRFWSLRGWTNHLVAPDPLLARYQSARARAATDPILTDELAPDERELFHADAAAAWRFIEQQTVSETGHAITTLSVHQNRVENTNTTLWDCASHIHGILAAMQIGLINAQDAGDRTARIVSHIPSLEIDGARLPPAIFDIKKLNVVRGDFDICDLGRFLLAMDQAVSQKVLSQEVADGVVRNWDLDAAIQDGRLHSFRHGSWNDITFSHCTDYILPAFTRRGYDVENIYTSHGSMSKADNEMAHLDTAAAAGPIGAEPSLLSLVEGEPNVAAGLLARVLFDAQLSGFERGGGYRCVSETPLDRSPWFSYQGLALDKDGPDAWTVNSRGASPDMQTDAFRHQTEVISAKAAYLWRAVMPHAYSNDLVRLIRENCRAQQMGFSVGVYKASGEPLRGYYDINTNGIILTALATILDDATTPRN